MMSEVGQRAGSSSGPAPGSQNWAYSAFVEFPLRLCGLLIRIMGIAGSLYGRVRAILAVHAPF